MLALTLLLVQTAAAVIVNSGECLLAATAAKSCCNEPLADQCLDDEAKALNGKLKAYEAKTARHTAGLRDAASEAQARSEAMRNSAALNLRSAEHCEQATAKCVAACSPLTTSDAKAALGRCNENPKLVQALRDQAARDEIQSKRAQRGLK